MADVKRKKTNAKKDLALTHENNVDTIKEEKPKRARKITKKDSSTTRKKTGSVKDNKEPVIPEKMLAGSTKKEYENTIRIPESVMLEESSETDLDDSIGGAFANVIETNVILSNMEEYGDIDKIDPVTWRCKNPKIEVILVDSNNEVILKNDPEYISALRKFITIFTKSLPRSVDELANLICDRLEVPYGDRDIACPALVVALFAAVRDNTANYKNVEDIAVIFKNARLVLFIDVNNAEMITNCMIALRGMSLRINENTKRMAYDILEPVELEVSEMRHTEEHKEMVNHPEHYQLNGVEAIDVMDICTQDLSGKLATRMSNVVKYMCRWNKKSSPIQDLQKALKYNSMTIELVTAEGAPPVNNIKKLTFLGDIINDIEDDNISLDLIPETLSKAIFGIAENLDGVSAMLTNNVLVAAYKFNKTSDKQYLDLIDMYLKKLIEVNSK